MSDAPIVLRRPRRAAAGHNFWIGITIGLLLCGITIAYGPIGLSVLASVVGFLLVTVFGLALAEVISKLRFRRDAGPARIELAPGELTVVSDYPERYRRSFRREDIVGVEVMRSTEQRSILKLIGPDEERSDAPMPWPRNQIGPDHSPYQSGVVKLIWGSSPFMAYLKSSSGA